MPFVIKSFDKYIKSYTKNGKKYGAAFLTDDVNKAQLIWDFNEANLVAEKYGGKVEVNNGVK